MQDVSQIISELFSRYDERRWGVTFDQLGLDGFDLMELRVRHRVFQDETGTRIILRECISNG